MIAESENTAVPAPSPIAGVAQRGFRRGASVAPVGAIVGAILGLAGEGSETLNPSDVALLLAAVLGFGLAPMLASIVSIARAVNDPERELPHPLIAGALISIAVSAVWACLAVLVALVAGSLVALDLDATRLLVPALIVAVVGGAVLGFVSAALVSLARTRGSTRS